MRNFLWIVMTLCYLGSYAQTEPKALSVGLMPGFLIAHTSDLKNIESHMLGLEVQWEQSKSKGSWTRYYNEPILGYGIGIFNLGRKETGQCFSFHANLRFNVFDLGKTKFQMRMGSGLGYLTKVFDPYTNRRNQAIGSHLNAFMQTAFLFDTDLEKGSIQYGIGMSHFSNAAFKMPNLGYNMPSFFLRYSFGKFIPLEGDLNGSKSGEVPKQQLAATLIFGQKQRNFAKPVTFNNKGVHLRYLRKRSEIGIWRVGVDAILDKTYKYSENTLVDLKSISLADQLELGVAAGHEWNAGRLGFLMEVGAYISKPADLKKPLYERMGFRYNVKDNLYVHATLKFHRGVADYFEWGVMYTFDI